MVEPGKLMTTFPHAAGTEVMKTPQDVAAILKLHQLGWGKKAIARELRISKNTVRRYLEAGGVLEYAKPQRNSLLEGKRNGWPRSCAGTDTMRTSCARSWNVKKAFR